MNAVTGRLHKNGHGRWEIEGFHLTSGDRVEIEVNGVWIAGFIECWGGNYHWFSRLDGVEVVLLPGIRARTPQPRGGSVF